MNNSGRETRTKVGKGAAWVGGVLGALATVIVAVTGLIKAMDTETKHGASYEATAIRVEFLAAELEDHGEQIEKNREKLGDATTAAKVLAERLEYLIRESRRADRRAAMSHGGGAGGGATAGTESGDVAKEIDELLDEGRPKPAAMPRPKAKARGEEKLPASLDALVQKAL